MSELITIHDAQVIAPAKRTAPVPLPAPRVAVSVRVATLDDMAFIDALQKKHGRALGFFPRAQMEGYIRGGNVLVAEGRHEGTEARRHEGEEKASGGRGQGSESESKPAATDSLAPYPSRLTPAAKPLGYVVSRDRYLKRDELGVIYQLCVSPEGQRKLVGATLIREVFARSPYGCRLYCCWCAQDLAANRFWEALGFVPLAFRTGGRGKGTGKRAANSEKSSVTPDPCPLSPRTHIFWQKRVRENDSTPWWYPSETGGGAIKEPRLVLPIPPGTHWSDAKPMIMPGGEDRHEGTEARRHEGEEEKSRRRSRQSNSAPARLRGSMPASLNRPMFAVPKPAKTRMSRGEKVARKNDPAMVAKARELRDRWLEQVNAGALLVAAGKYRLEDAPVGGGEANGLFLPGMSEPRLLAG